MTWQFKRPENGRIDGKTPEEWERAGVSRWLVSYGGLTYAVGNPRILDCFHTDREYAPATAEMLPAPWPELWPEVEPQPAVVIGRHVWVVIPAAEMTALVLYGHLAMGGTWKWRDSENGWTAQDGGEGGAWWDPSVEEDDDGEQWTPCDEHGNFCELRRVVSDTSAEVERRRVDDLDKELVDLRRALQCLSKERYLATAAAEEELAEARQELARYRGGVARLTADLEGLLSAGPEVDDDKA